MWQELVCRFIEGTINERTGFGRGIQLIIAAVSCQMTGDIEGHDEIRFLKLFTFRKKIAVEQKYAGRERPGSGEKYQEPVVPRRGS